MLNSDTIKNIDDGSAIFPLVTQIQPSGRFKSIGTAFVIHELGIALTAKHVLFFEDQTSVSTLFAVHTEASNSKSFTATGRLVPHKAVPALPGAINNLLHNLL